MDTGDALELLGRPELERLWAAARRRLEGNGAALTTTPIVLDDLTDDEVTAICALLAQRRPAGNRLRVTLANLDAALRASSARCGLIETLEVLSGGPVIDRRARRADQRQQVTDLWRTAAAHPAAASEPVERWLASVRQRGRLTRLGVDDPAELLRVALDCAGWLITHQAANIDQPVPLPVLATGRLGDAHGLDPETPLGVLLADAVLTLSGAADVRSAWLSFGVQLDRVSSSALTYLLPGRPGTVVAAARASAEPLRITSRMLERDPGLLLEPGDVVWLCENPAIVSLAADRLGAGCGPLVCLEGMPSSVTGLLLTQLVQLGAVLRVHTDFDLGGVAIMNHVTARHGAAPWRMGCADYLAAAQGASIELEQVIGATPWDPDLSPAMNHQRRAVHEEAIADQLLADLAR